MYCSKASPADSVTAQEKVESNLRISQDPGLQLRCYAARKSDDIDGMLELCVEAPRRCQSWQCSLHYQEHS